MRSTKAIIVTSNDSFTWDILASMSRRLLLPEEYYVPFEDLGEVVAEVGLVGDIS